MSLLSLIQSGFSKITQKATEMARDVALPQRIFKAEVDVNKLEKRVAQLQHSSDSFHAATGQRSESPELTQARAQLYNKVHELQGLRQEEATRRAQAQQQQLNILRNIRS